MTALYGASDLLETTGAVTRCRKRRSPWRILDAVAGIACGVAFAGIGVVVAMMALGVVMPLIGGR